MDYLMSHLAGIIDIKAFEQSRGMEVVVTSKKIEQEVEKFIEAHLREIKEKRLVLKIIKKNSVNFLFVFSYHLNVGFLMNEVRNNLKWVVVKVVKSKMNIHILVFLDPKRMQI
jgi:hypothetical protein